MLLTSIYGYPVLHNVDMLCIGCISVALLLVSIFLLFYIVSTMMLVTYVSRISSKSSLQIVSIIVFINVVFFLLLGFGIHLE